MYTINDPNNTNSTGPPIKFTGDLTAASYFSAIGDGNGSSSFVLFRRSAAMAMYYFGDDNGYKSVSQLQVSVTDPWGAELNPPQTQPSSSSTGAIVGGIAGFVVLAGLVIFFIKRKWSNKNKAESTTAAQDKNQQHLDQPDNYIRPQPLGQNGGPNTHDPTWQYPAISYPPGQTAPTAILPMAPISSPRPHQTS